MWRIAYPRFLKKKKSLGSQFRNMVPLRNTKEVSEYFFVFDSMYSDAVLLWIHNITRWLTPLHSLLRADPRRMSCNVAQPVTYPTTQPRSRSSSPSPLPQPTSKFPELQLARGRIQHPTSWILTEKMRIKEWASEYLWEEMPGSKFWAAPRFSPTHKTLCIFFVAPQATPFSLILSHVQAACSLATCR